MLSVNSYPMSVSRAGGGDTESSSGSSHGSSENLPAPPRLNEEEEHKNKQSSGGTYRSSEGMFPGDCVNEDLKRLESLSSMMASVESNQLDEKRRSHRNTEESVSPSLPPLPTSLDIMTATLATPDQTSGKMPKQSRHSKSRTAVAQEPPVARPSTTTQASPGGESRQRMSSHERKLHKKKSPVTDYLHNVKADSAGLLVPASTNVPGSSKKDRHKSDKRASVNQEGLKVKITFNKSETKASETNHVLPPPPLPPMPPLPTHSAPISQQNLKMKINRKYLENNGKMGSAAPSQPREGPELKDFNQVQSPVAPSSESEAGKKKQEGLKLVISKDRLSQSSHNKKQDRESRKRERNSPKGHDPLRNSEGFPNKVTRLDHHSGHGGSRSQMSMPPPPAFIRGPPQGQHYTASNGKSDSYMQSQPMMMQYAQPPLYSTLPHQQYFQYQNVAPNYPSQGLPQFLTNPLPPPPPPPPLEPPPRDRPPLPRDPPPPPPPLPPE